MSEQQRIEKGKTCPVLSPKPETPAMQDEPIALGVCLSCNKVVLNSKATWAKPEGSFCECRSLKTNSSKPAKPEPSQAALDAAKRQPALEFSRGEAAALLEMFDGQDISVSVARHEGKLLAWETEYAEDGATVLRDAAKRQGEGLDDSPIKHFSVASGKIRFELYSVPMEIEAHVDAVSNGPERIGAIHKLLAALHHPPTEKVEELLTYLLNIPPPQWDYKEVLQMANRAALRVADQGEKL